MNKDRRESAKEKNTELYKNPSFMSSPKNSKNR